MKKIVIVLSSIFMMTSCTYVNKIVTSEKITESNSENKTAIAASAYDITDDELKEMYECAYDMVRGKEFFNDGSGGFFTKEGKSLDEYKEEFNKTFTDKYTEEYFKLEKGGVYSDSNEQRHLEILALQDENSVNDLNAFSNYEGIWVGLGDRGSDLSAAESETAVTYRSDDKIILTVTVWHTNPGREAKIGEDYIYHLENGRLTVLGKFGGLDENGECIIIEDELSGTAADVPVGKDKSEFYNKNYDNYLIENDYTLIFDGGTWKFDNFVIWD